MCGKACANHWDSLCIPRVEFRSAALSCILAGTLSGALWQKCCSLINKMIAGSGIDVIEIARIQHSMDRFGGRFLNRVYLEAEQAYCRRKRNAAESFAARFAAKEAAAKALGTGISFGVNWLEIEVVREPSGKPGLRFHGRAAQIAGMLGVVRSALSLTHTAQLAMASVVLEDGL
jgi:holo-[acyl-carrier protein] synthase